MTTPQNLPALIKEMQERAWELYVPKCINTQCDNHGTITAMGSDGEPEPEQCQYCYQERFPLAEALTHVAADTANAIVEYVKGVAGDMRPTEVEKVFGDLIHNSVEYRTVDQFITDLIARLTSNQ
jgi:hypothetical protein